MPDANSPTSFNEHHWLERHYPLPEPHANVRLLIRSANLRFLHYTGAGKDLIAAGVATPEMLAPGIHGQERFDPAGHPFWRHKRGDRYTIIRRPRTREAALVLPGVVDQLRTWPGACVCYAFITTTPEEDAAFKAEARQDRFADRAARWPKR